MIELLSSAFGVISKTPIRSRKTKLQAVDNDCLFHLETIKELGSITCVSYESTEFPDFYTPEQTNVDLEMFVSFTVSDKTDPKFDVYTMTSIVDDIEYSKYQITIKKEFFTDLCIVKYKRSITKLIRAITGV